MRKVLLAAVLVCLLSGRAGGQCCGDCNGDGVVAINELITAVNKSLTDCADATPTEPPAATPTPANRCPFTFEDSGNLCTFRGRFNQGCGAELTSLLTSNGSLVIIQIDTMTDDPPTVAFSAQVDSATTAHLTAWSRSDTQRIHPIEGQVQLAANGEQLVIFPNDPPFMILGCFFVRYAGDYVAANQLSEQQSELGPLNRSQARPIPELSESE